MRRIIISSVWMVLVFMLAQTPAKACTTFCIRDAENLILGRNLDFNTGHGHVVVNKRNVVKTALTQAPEKPFQWVSKYGSITFNQIGREFPYGGMNEKGLVIEQMWLGETQYPEPDNRYGLTELQWIQYQLDNAATVDEVLQSDSFVRVSKSSLATLHFIVCDRSGNSATIEYLNGRMVYHTQTSLPVCALSNDPYQKSYDYLKTLSGFGGSSPIPHTTGSLDRFARAASMVRNYNHQNVIDYSFAVLKNVSQGPQTKWSIVYDIRQGAVYYKTDKNETIRTFRVADFDLSCGSPALYIDMEEDMHLGKLPFKEYSYRSNRELIDNVFNSVDFLRALPVQARELYANYPGTTQCRK